jgi:hypothetical protein
MKVPITGATGSGWGHALKALAAGTEPAITGLALKPPSVPSWALREIGKVGDVVAKLRISLPINGVATGFMTTTLRHPSNSISSGTASLRPSPTRCYG